MTMEKEEWEEHLKAVHRLSYARRTRYLKQRIEHFAGVGNKEKVEKFTRQLREHLETKP